MSFGEASFYIYILWREGSQMVANSGRDRVRLPGMQPWLFPEKPQISNWDNKHKLH